MEGGERCLCFYFSLNCVDWSRVYGYDLIEELKDCLTHRRIANEVAVIKCDPCLYHVKDPTRTIPLDRQ
jgi:hypothetical protein